MSRKCPPNREIDVGLLMKITARASIQAKNVIYFIWRFCRHGKSVAQVLLRWGVQQGFITIPKSTNPERIIQNSEVFDFKLSDEDMAALVRINQTQFATEFSDCYIGT